MNMPHLTARACKTEWICSFFAPRALRIRGWLKSKTVQRGYTVAWAFCWLPVIEFTESLQCVPCEICSFNVHSSWNPHQFGKYDVTLKYHELSTFIMPELLTNNQFQPWLTENHLRFHNQLLEKSWFGRPGTCFQIRVGRAFKGIHSPVKISPPPPTSQPVDQSHMHSPIRRSIASGSSEAGSWEMFPRHRPAHEGN